MVGPNLPFGGLACGLVLGPLPSPWAAAISTTEFGTVWEPDANRERGLRTARPAV